MNKQSEKVDGMVNKWSTSGSGGYRERGLLLYGVDDGTAVALGTSDQAVLSQSPRIYSMCGPGAGQVYCKSNIFVRSGRQEFLQKLMVSRRGTLTTSTGEPG